MNPDEDPASFLRLGLSGGSAEESDNAGSRLELEGLEVREFLGRGGMGSVWRACNPVLNRDVAVKRLTAIQGDLDSARLIREGQALASLDHPHVVHLYDLRFDQSGQPCLIMEYLPGGDLAQRLRLGKFDFSDALRIFREVASGVAYAHGKGLLHRDLKPANILFARDGRAKVVDFGLASFTGESGLTLLTVSGTTLGTYDYMSPEQKNGEALDKRSDIYSLGVILYELVSGKRPSGMPKPLRNRRLQNVVNTCLQEDPDKRYADVGDLIKELPQPKGRRAFWLLATAAVAAVALWVLFPKDSSLEAPETNEIPSVNETVTTAEPTVVAQVDSTDPSVASGVEREPTEVPRDLLALARQTDNLRSRGNWYWQGDTLVTQRDPRESRAWFELPSPGTSSYRLIVEMERTAGIDSMPIFFTTSAGTAGVEFDAWRAGIGGIQDIDGRDMRASKVNFKARHRTGQIDQVEIQVMPETVEIFLSGQSRWSLDLRGRSLSTAPLWGLPGGIDFAVGIWEGDAIFHRIAWEPIED